MHHCVQTNSHDKSQAGEGSGAQVTVNKWLVSYTIDINILMT
jgi:hypothetical protein